MHRNFKSPRSEEPPEKSCDAPSQTRRGLVLALAPACAVALAALPTRSALALGPAKSPAVLTVSGKVRLTNDGATAVFDMVMLEALPQTVIATKTPWYPEVRTFTGPLLRDVLSHCGAHGDTLRLRALNDFRATMPFSDAHKFSVILARLIDGKPMTVRDKGPLFVMYPFGAVDELRTAVYYSRAVWQLHSIEAI